LAKKDIIINFINHPKASLKLYSKKLVFKLLKKDYYENHPQSSFNDFSGFLANSLISPIVYAPFREQDKRCFATMENITGYLTQLSEKENDNPLVSIIMPVYNRVDIVESAIDSVLEQTYSNIELIIVDDGSDDGSKELLESLNDQRIRLLHNDSCKGVSNSRNKGLSVAKGKYIAYLDSDNTWDSRYIAAMVGAFIELPDAEVLYSGQLLFKGDSEKPYAVRFGSFNKSLLTNRNYIDLNALCHTYDLFKRIGGFDETLIRLVDYDLIMRMAETTQIYSVPVILSHYFFNKAENTITNIPDYKKYLEIVRDYRETRIENINKTINGLNSNKLTKKVSIIIPSYEALDDIKECIESLFELNIDKWLEIIVVDNFSSHPIIEYLEELEANGKIKLIKNDINFGFTYAVNQGIAIAETGNDIVIMNNDAILTSGAIESLQKAAYELSDCGVVVPQQVLPGDTKTITTHVPYAYPNFECDVNLSAVHENIMNVPVFHSGSVVELSFAPFFCVYIKRDVLNNSLGLDAEYGRHYRSDRIFCNYLRHMMHLKIYYIAEAVVYHKLQKSTDMQRNNPEKNSNFDIMFRKNKWDEKLASRLGYKLPVWDY